MSTVIAVKGLSIALAQSPDRPIVKDVEFELAKGRITGLAGGSGAGKSLTARSLFGLLEPGQFHSEAERLELNGAGVPVQASVDWLELRRKKLSLVVQDPGSALDPVMRIGKQISERLLRSGCPAAHCQARGREALSFVGFQDPEALYEYWPHELSGGMKQLVLIAMAISTGPDVLVADEPTTALDMRAQARVLHCLRRIADEKNTAILLISHDLRVMAELADELIIMDKGEVVERGETKRIFASPRHQATRLLISSAPGDETAVPERPADSGQVTLKATGLGYRYPNAKRPALEDVDLDIAAGEIVGLAGESGSGKSTLARILVRLIEPKDGAINDPAADNNETGSQRLTQIVFQDPGSALNPRRSIRQALLEPISWYALPGDPADRIRQAMNSVDLEEKILDRFPHQLSSGQRQRVCIARALVCEPKVLVLDESVASLDVVTQARILELLAELRAEQGISILFISHDLSVLRQLADRVGIMFAGRLVELAPASRIFSQPAHPYTAALLASEPRKVPGNGPSPQPGMGGPGTGPASTGCAYRPQCPRASELCESTRPPVSALSDASEHRLECHYPIPTET